jgi:two-component system KDP operon response regulator KdpE
MSVQTVLIVDDELHIRRLLKNTLERAGYGVEEAVGAREALRIAASRPLTAVLLDLGLPAREATDQKVAALDLGAEDYVTKPFDTEELLARLRVALRGRGEATSRPTVLRAHGVEIDFEHRLVRRGNEEAHLTRKEFDVLSALAAHPGRVVTHQRILEAAWPTDHDRRIEYLRIVVRNLRQKLEGAGGVGTVIANELGIGYRLLVDA